MYEYKRFQRLFVVFGYLLPAALGSTILRFASRNLSEQWVTNDVLRLVMGRALTPQCLLITIRDGCLPHSYFSQVLGLKAEGSYSMATTVFQVMGNAQRDANVTALHMLKMMEEARRLRLSSWCVTVVVLSDDPAFLAAFAEASDAGRLMVWDTRLVIMTRLVMTKIRSLLQDYWTFSMMNTIFLTPMGYPLSRWEGYVYLPYSPAGIQVKRVGSWQHGNTLSLAKGQKFFPQKYNNFHGMDVNMTWFPLPPYWMPVSGSASDSFMGSTFAGRDVIIIETIAAALNFTIHLVPYRGTENWMIPLRTREAFLRPIILPIMPHMLEEFDITFFVERNTLAFAMAMPTLKPTWHSLFFPLQAEVWVSVAATVIVVFIVLLMMKSGDDAKSQEAWLVTRQVVGTLLDEAIHGDMPRRNSTRVALTAWLLFAFIVGTVYRSNLTAFLTVPTYPFRAENLADLVDMGVKVTILPEMVMFYQSFKESGSQVLMAVAENMEYVPTDIEGLHQSITANKAYLYERLYLELKIAEHFTSEDGSTPLYVTQRNFLPGYSTFILTRNNPFKASLDHYILAFHEAGLIRKWTTDVMRTTKRGIMKNKGESKVEIQEEEESILSLTLVHMQGPFFLFATGIAMSLIAFISENISVILYMKT